MIWMIDSVFSFSSESSARQDLKIRNLLDLPGYVIKDLKIWYESQDEIIKEEGYEKDKTNISVKHNYISGWGVLISLSEVNENFLDHPNMLLVFDRKENNLIKNNLKNHILKDIRFSPVFAGVEYNWGNWKEKEKA
jgi:hypothetical protein